MSSASHYLPTTKDWSQISARGTIDVKEEEAEITQLGAQMGSTDGQPQPQAAPHALASPSLDSHYSPASPASTGTSASVTFSDTTMGVLDVLGYGKDLPMYSQYPHLMNLPVASVQDMNDYQNYQPHIQAHYASQYRPSTAGSGMHVGLQQLGQFDQPQYQLPTLSPVSNCLLRTFPNFLALFPAPIHS